MKLKIFLGLILLTFFTFGCFKTSSATPKRTSHLKRLSAAPQHYARTKLRHLSSRKRVLACLMKIRNTCKPKKATCARFAHGNLCRHFGNDCARLIENCKQSKQVYTAVDINMCRGVTSTRTLPCKSNASADD